MMACLMISRLIYISLDYLLVYSKVGKVHVTPIKYSQNLLNPLKRLINPLFSPFAANSSWCSLPVHKIRLFCQVGRPLVIDLAN